MGNLIINNKIEIYIYFVYTLYLLKFMDIHKLPIRFKTHAALRLIRRFDMDTLSQNRENDQETEKRG